MIKKTTEPKRKKKQKFLTVSPSFERKRLQYHETGSE